jgi:hypothetical protein
LTERKKLIPGCNYGVGDTVVCVNPSFYTDLKQGKIYEVQAYNDEYDSIALKGVDGGAVWFTWRFKLIGTATNDDFTKPEQELEETLNKIVERAKYQKYGPFHKMADARPYLDKARMPFVIRTSHLGMRTTLCIELPQHLETYKEGILSDRFISELSDVTIEEVSKEW